MTHVQTSKELESLHSMVELFNLATGFMKSQCLYTAAKLNIADLLQQGPLSIQDLSKKTGTQPLALERLLNTLIVMGIFQRTEQQKISNTSLSTLLQSDHPYSQRSYILLLGDASWWNSWGRLDYSVTTGQAAFDQYFKMSYTEYLEQNPQLSDTFNDCMTRIAKGHIPAILNSYDFSRFNSIIDIGGGQGSLVKAIIEKNPHLTGTVFDLEHVIKDAILHIPSGQQGQLEYISGNFFESVPKGKDAYLLKQIIHDWGDDECVRILTHCRKAMAPNGRILVIDAVLDADNASVINYLFDLHMLVTAPGGKERTITQFNYLFQESGLELMNIITTPSSFCILEGKAI